MSEEREFLEEPDDETYPITQPAPRKRGWAWPAWIIILSVVALAVYGQIRRSESKAADPDDSRTTDIIFDLQVRYLLGADEFLRGQSSVNIYESAEKLDQGDLQQRLRFVVVAGEIAGPAQALSNIDLLRRQIAKTKLKISEDERKLLATLDVLYRDYENLRFDAPSLTAADRPFLRKELGWFGDLALAPRGARWFDVPLAASGGCTAPAALSRRPPDPQTRARILAPAEQTFWTLISAVGAMALLGLFGFGLLVLFLVFIFSGRVHSSMQCGGILHGNIYAETFALWILVFVGMSVAAHFLADELENSLVPAAAAMLLSLLALLWPVLRGVPWRQVRQDIGWTAGRRPLLEPVIGLGSYAMALPLLAVGVALTLALMWLQTQFATQGPADPFAPSSYPAHPIIKQLAEGGLYERLQVLFLATFVAPIVEETMFRGVLYRHLREASCRAGGVLSIFFSGTVVSFIFAIIHPQGWVAVPALMSLAYGFTIAREWRGTLVPAMVGHGINNGIVTIVVMLALGS